MRQTQQKPFDWRRKASKLARQLHHTHDTVEALGSALDRSDDAVVTRMKTSAEKGVRTAAASVNELHGEQPHAEPLPEPDAIGSSLAIGGGGMAAVALDVMVNAMTALAATDDTDDTDFLVAASMDCEKAYEVGTAVVHTVAHSDDSGITDLLRAYETDGSKALRVRLAQARPRVLAIKDRVGVAG